MNLSFECAITEIVNAIQNEYNFSNKYFSEIEQLVQDVFKSLSTNGKICKFAGYAGSTKKHFYNIIMPYIVAFLAKYTDFHVVCVFETIYELDRFKIDVKNIKNKCMIKNHHQFKLTLTTIHRVKNVCIGLTPDLVIGWMTLGYAFAQYTRDTLSISRFNAFLLIVGDDYFDCDRFEERMHLILHNGFKIRQ